MDANREKIASVCNIEMIPRSKLTYTNDDSRSFDGAKVKRLRASIRRYGFILPLIVVRTDNGYYRIVDGVSRFLHTNYTEYPCVVLSNNEPIAPFLLNVHGEFDFSMVCNMIAYQLQRESVDSLSKDIGIDTNLILEALQSVGLME